MLVYDPVDVNKLLDAKRLSWVFKAQLINSYVEQLGSTQAVANKLGCSKRFVADYVLLSKNCKLYPKLCSINLKMTALKLLQEHRKNPKIMRLKIAERVAYEQSGLHEKNSNDAGDIIVT